MYNARCRQYKISYTDTYCIAFGPRLHIIKPNEKRTHMFYIIKVII